MGDVSTEDHGWSFGEDSQLLAKRHVATTALHVDLEGQVGAVLLVGAAGVLHLHALRGDTDLGVGDALDVAVETGVSAGQDNKDELGGATEGLVCALVGTLQGSHVVVIGGNGDGWVACKRDASVFAGHHQLINEGADFFLADTTAKDANTPRLNGTASLDLLAAQVPGTTLRTALGLLSVFAVEDGRRGKEATVQGDETLTDGDAELIVEGLGRFKALLDTSGGTDGTEAVHRGEVSDADHFTGLLVVELAGIALSVWDGADLDGQVGGTATTADHEARQPGVFQDDLVLLGKVLGNADSATIFKTKGEFSGGELGEVLDLVATRHGQVFGLDAEVAEEGVKDAVLAFLELNAEDLAGWCTEQGSNGGGAVLGCGVKGSGCGVDVQEELACSTRAEGQEHAAPHLQGTRDGSCLGRGIRVDGATDDDAGLDERMAEDHFQGGDGIVGGVKETTSQEFVDDGHVDGRDLADGNLEDAFLAAWLGVFLRQLDLKGVGGLGERAEGVHGSHAIIGNQLAIELGLAVLLLELGEDDALEGAGNIGSDDDVMLDDLTNGQSLHLQVVGLQTDDSAGLPLVGSLWHSSHQLGLQLLRVRESHSADALGQGSRHLRMITFCLGKRCLDRHSYEENLDGLISCGEFGEAQTNVHFCQGYSNLRRSFLIQQFDWPKITFSKFPSPYLLESS